MTNNHGENLKTLVDLVDDKTVTDPVVIQLHLGLWLLHGPDVMAEGLRTLKDAGFEHEFSLPDPVHHERILYIHLPRFRCLVCIDVSQAYHDEVQSHLATLH